MKIRSRVPVSRTRMRSYLQTMRGALPWVVAAMVFTGCSNPPSPISITLTSSAKAIDQGVPLTVAVTATLINDKSGKGVTWTLTGPGTITSTIDSATFNPPTVPISSPQPVTLTATSVAQPSKTASVQITVNPYPAIPSQTLPAGTVGAAYSVPTAATGGTAPFLWSIYKGPIETGFSVGGSLPDGLTLDANTGVISGTPTAAGTWYFESVLVDADNADPANSFMSIQINPATTTAVNPVPLLNQPLLPSAAAAGSASLTLSVSGTNFVSGATVDFNGAPLTTTFVDTEHLTAVVPPTSVATAGTTAVTVVNPAPGAGSSNVVFFQVGAPKAEVSFANAANSPLPISDPFGLAIADVNQDGKPDLAIASGLTLDVLISNGDGTFTPTLGSPIEMPSPPYADFPSPHVGPIAVGDFNHSGHVGLAVSETNNEAAVILLGSGNGSFAFSSTTFANLLGSPVSSIQAADFNADGNLDLAFANYISGVSAVDLGYGDGAFSSGGIFFENIEVFPLGLTIGDFNGDGKLDVALASAGTTVYPDSGVIVALGDGDGNFTPAKGSPLSFGQSLSAIVAADFNGDGKLDLAVTDQTANTVRVLLGNGDGTFQTPSTFTVGNQPAAMVIGDFNNDGKLDIATANYGDGTVTLLLGNGDGTFTPSSGSPYLVGPGPAAIVAADFNGDGKLDLAVANFADGTGTVSILLQQ